MTALPCGHYHPPLPTSDLPTGARHFKAAEALLKQAETWAADLNYPDNASLAIAVAEIQSLRVAAGVHAQLSAVALAVTTAALEQDSRDICSDWLPVLQP